LKYPEHEKLHAITDKSQAIGEFVDWLDAEKSIVLARRHEHGDDCRSEEGFLMCGYSTNDLIPAGVRIQTLLAEFFGIDEEKIEREKREMLAEIRSAER
jgi:hypothetical protein